MRQALRSVSVISDPPGSKHDRSPVGQVGGGPGYPRVVSGGKGRGDPWRSSGDDVRTGRAARHGICPRRSVRQARASALPMQAVGADTARPQQDRSPLAQQGLDRLALGQNAATQSQGTIFASRCPEIQLGGIYQRLFTTWNPGETGLFRWSSEIFPERRHFLRNPKWGPSDFGCKKSGDGHGLRRPTFVLRPSRRALRSSLTLPRFPVLLHGACLNGNRPCLGRSARPVAQCRTSAPSNAMPAGARGQGARPSMWFPVMATRHCGR